MKTIKINLILLLPLCMLIFADLRSSGQQTYCNPLNINYSMTAKGRHSADPVVVLFKDKYYLFTTADIKGYRVSDDLFDWKDILFSKETWAKVNSAGAITAPAVATDGNFIYFINFNTGNRQGTVDIFKTKNPASGVWEVCGNIRTIADPALFIDNGRFFVYYGLGAIVPTQCFELDSITLTEIPGSNKILRPALKGVADYTGGYHRGRRELFEQVDASEWFGKFSNEPCPEAAWMTKFNDKYYLQYATPGTVSHWYCDIVMEGDSPTGPFKESAYNPVSMKVGGFIGSAGHSCVFQDKNGLWWRITTMWVGKHDLFERRLGLFPVSFDEKGRMRTHTLMGDYPLYRNFRMKNNEVLRPEWNILSYNKKVEASSCLDTFRVENATDENVRTWWSARSGNPGEWMSVDLGKMVLVKAIQINFAEQDVKKLSPDESDYHSYKLYKSNDGQNWELLIDKSANLTAVPHDYLGLDSPAKFRYVKIENVHMALSGKFAVSDLRIFGNDKGNLPEKVTITELKRDQSDSRNAVINWEKSKTADGYLVRFGIEKNILNQCIQVKGADKNSLGIHVLRKDTPYFFRIDAYNSSGIRQGGLFSKE